MANEPYTDPLSGAHVGTESSLSNWAGPYVTEMLGRGQALASMPYTAYTGPLSAGPTDLQDTAFRGLAALSIPDASATTYNPISYTDPGVASLYMSPYITEALNPQLEEAKRQAEIARVNNAGRMTAAGSYGGGRQAIMESELTRNLLRNLADITGKGYQTAYEQGASQFNSEEDRRLAAAGANRQYGLEGLAAQLAGGKLERDILNEGILADYEQFREERDFPYKQVQYMQSLLQGLPLGTQSYSYMDPSGLTQLTQSSGGIMKLLKDLGLIS